MSAPGCADDEIEHYRQIINDLKVESARLLTLADKARGFVAARQRWHNEATRVEGIPDVTFQRDYDDTLAELVDAVKDAGLVGSSHSEQQVGRQFLSNACIHGNHDKCEKECPYCRDSCSCTCHEEDGP